MSRCRAFGEPAAAYMWACDPAMHAGFSGWLRWKRVVQGLRELLAEHLWPALGITAEAQDALQPFIYFQQWWRTGKPLPTLPQGLPASLFPV